MAVSQADLRPAQLPFARHPPAIADLARPFQGKYNGTFQEQSCASRGHIRSIGLCLLG